MRATVLLALAILVAGCAPQTVIANKQQAVVEAWSHSDAVAHAEKECGTHGRWPLLTRQQGGEYWFSCNETEEAIAARLKAQQAAAMKRAAELNLFAAPAPSAPPTQVASLAPVPSAPTTPAPVTGTARSGIWVQVGAFRTKAAAERHARTVRAAQGGAVAGREAVVAEKTLATGGSIHVARLGPFAAHADARQACSALKARGTGCFVILLP